MQFFLKQLLFFCCGTILCYSLNISAQIINFPVLPELKKCAKPSAQTLRDFLKIGIVTTAQKKQCQQFCQKLNSKSYLITLNKQLHSHFKDIKQSQAAIKKAVELSFLKSARALVLLGQQLHGNNNSALLNDLTTINQQKNYQLSAKEQHQLTLIYSNILPFFKDQTSGQAIPEKSLQALQSALIKITAQESKIFRVTQRDIDLLNMTYAPVKRHKGKRQLSKKRFFTLFIDQMQRHYPHRNFLADDFKIMTRKIKALQHQHPQTIKQLKKIRQANIKKLANFIQAIKNSASLCYNLNPNKFNHPLNVICLGKKATSLLDKNFTQFARHLISYVENSRSLTPYISVAAPKFMACYDKTLNVTHLTAKRLPSNQEWRIKTTAKNIPLTNDDLKYSIKIDLPGKHHQIKIFGRYNNRTRIIKTTNCPLPIKQTLPFNKKIGKKKVPPTPLKKAPPLPKKKLLPQPTPQLDIKYSLQTVSPKVTVTFEVTRLKNKVNAEITCNGEKVKKAKLIIKQTAKEQKLKCSAHKEGNMDANIILKIPALKITTPPVPKKTNKDISVSIFGDSPEGSGTKWQLTAEVSGIGDQDNIECSSSDDTISFSLSSNNLTHTITKQDEAMEITCTVQNVKSNTVIVPAKEVIKDKVVKSSKQKKTKSTSIFRPMQITPPPPPQLIQLPPRQPFFLPGMP